MAADLDAFGIDQRFPVITDEGLYALRRLIGVKVTDTVEPWCYEVTRDNIRHYAHGIGDDNPLWCDPQYAAQSVYGRLAAPPSFVFALNRILSGYVGGLPGIHAMWSGADMTWHRPFLLGDEIHCEAYLKDLIEHETRFAGRAIQQIYHVDFYNQEDQLLVSADSWCFRTERDAARELGTKYDGVKDDPKPYTAKELERVWAMYDSETVRGSEPLYIEDVALGDALPPDGQGPNGHHRFYRLRGRAGAVSTFGPTGWHGNNSRSIQASASRTASAFRMCRKGCTGMTAWLGWLAHRVRTTTDRSGARG